MEHKNSAVRVLYCFDIHTKSQIIKEGRGCFDNVRECFRSDYWARRLIRHSEKQESAALIS
jgi:hypothetical protein